MIPCPPYATGCSDGDPALDEPASVCRGIGHATCEGGSFPLNAFGVDFLSAVPYSRSWTSGKSHYVHINILEILREHATQQWQSEHVADVHLVLRVKKRTLL